ncbi:MAG TPA: TIM barrel protein [Methanocella sp.]|uniref:TIM barrel protein n=1 Tax=Methanocella sp. TaxID=2052833 RepID=UPI002C4955DA|nr:TIM barrel protein [Methanocella sp.]HTY91507.1 TIM barrel protein [Methanocella sp.]
MIRVGIAGIPYHAKGEGTEAGIRYLCSIGLSAMEVQFVRNVYMTPKSASESGAVARECELALSVHAPYYINLTSSSAATQEKSKDWIMKSLRIAEPLGAGIVVFHPAREKEPDILKQHLSELSKARKKEKIQALIGLEVTGDAPELGSVEDYMDILRDVPGTDIVIDWSHVHARTSGGLRSKADYEAVFDMLKPVKKNDFHMHFSNVEYKNGREVRHLPLDGQPPFEPLAQILKERKLNATIICETPLLEEDALKMKAILEAAD